MVSKQVWGKSKVPIVFWFQGRTSGFYCSSIPFLPLSKCLIYFQVAGKIPSEFFWTENNQISLINTQLAYPCQWWHHTVERDIGWPEEVNRPSSCCSPALVWHGLLNFSGDFSSHLVLGLISWSRVFYCFSFSGSIFFIWWIGDVRLGTFYFFKKKRLKNSALCLCLYYM